MLSINPSENCRMPSPGEMGVCGLPKTDRHSQKPWIDRTFAHNLLSPPYHNLRHLDRSILCERHVREEALELDSITWRIDSLYI